MADGGRCIGSLNQAPFLRAVCPKACAQAFDKLGLVHDPASACARRATRSACSPFWPPAIDRRRATGARPPG